ncbi:CRE-DAO-4 protein [Caenorhabditis remanei]|uniref:CRE-DAO-4 protein n=1 Tax=Caenorhabditis remanei TaxID=31234 RepID=E3MMP2_CAERE|nr:CRE-DAO-4 protein [Caenorhabditis remanei]
MRFALFSILCLGFAYFSYTDAYLFDPKAVDALLREIRARLQATGDDPHAKKIEQETEEIKKEELMQAEGDVEGSGSGEEIEGSGEVVSNVTGVPIMEEEGKVDKKEKEAFPRPEPIFDKYGNLKSKDQLESLTYSNFKKQAPITLQGNQQIDSLFSNLTISDHYNKNPTGTLQMLQGLDIHGNSNLNIVSVLLFLLLGASGGYHRALSGGYLPPATYDPYNVNWHSYGDEGVKMKDKAISVFRRVIAPGV